MERKTKKWLVAGALTIAVAIGVGICYSNTSDKSGRENKEAVASKEDKNKPKEAKAAQKDKKSYYPLTIKTKGPDGKEYETVYEKQPEKVVAVYQGNVETMLALGLEDKIAERMERSDGYVTVEAAAYFRRISGGFWQAEKSGGVYTF